MNVFLVWQDRALSVGYTF